ncbi:MAG: methionyl-tRNA formyltransferase, partial [Gemmatimonadetes bacterium]|nr:methionyl-tRNA formyltransferase [Gemmatimonadota bacterium]
MKLVFFGSPAGGATALRALVEAGFEVAAVYTRPDRPAGRSAVPQPTAVGREAEALGLPVRTPGSWREEGAIAGLASWGADAFVVVAYGRILPGLVLAVPRLGVVNVHPSLLPRFRGPSPVQTAILEGETHTGVTIMLLDQGMDMGPILARSAPEPVRPGDTGGSLTARLFEIGARLLVRALRDWEAGAIAPEPQDEAGATVTRLLRREDGALDWTESAARLERQVRAYDPWPGAHTLWRGRNLKVLAARMAPEAAGEAGVVTVRSGRPVVATGAGGLKLVRVQLEGRRA